MQPWLFLLLHAEIAQEGPRQFAAESQVVLGEEVFHRAQVERHDYNLKKRADDHHKAHGNGATRVGMPDLIPMGEKKVKHPLKGLDLQLAGLFPERRVGAALDKNADRALLRGEDDRWPIFLLGAGASFRSGVPNATDAVKKIARIVYSERKLQGARRPERVRPTEWEPWLQQQPWFNRNATSLAENFLATVEHLLFPPSCASGCYSRS